MNPQSGRVTTYLTQQIVTATPAKLVFLLYDRAILSLREAIAAIEAGDIQGRWKANNRAIEIVSHMWSTLDVERGGDVAANLDRLFPFMMNRLSDVDLGNDPQPAREVIELLEPLRESWRQIAFAQGAAGAPGGANAEPPAPAAPGSGEALRTRLSA